MNLELNDRHITTLLCTNCRRTVQVRIDRHATGNMTIRCPECGHFHFRYCEDGEITEDRWRTGANTMSPSRYSMRITSGTSSYTDASSGFLTHAWHNTTGSN